MKVLVLGNNWVAAQGARTIRKCGGEIAGLVVHPRERSRCREEIIEAAGVPADRIFEAPMLQDPRELERIRELDAQWAISLFFGYILKAPFLEMFPDRAVNLHPALLPYGKGAYPNVWAILDQTPAGATLHHIDAGVDTGRIVAQKDVRVELWDTGASLHCKLETACAELFEEEFPKLMAGTTRSVPQPAGGITRRVKDVQKIDRIDLDASYRAGDLINILRARTFPPHKGAYIQDDAGRRIYLRLELDLENLEEEEK